MNNENVSLEELLKQQEAITASIAAKREAMKEALKQEAADFVAKIERSIEGSSYEAVRFIADSVSVKLAQKANSASTTGKAKKPRKKLNQDQEAEIAELYGQQMSIADISKRIYTAPSNSDYQRINVYIKRHLKA